MRLLFPSSLLVTVLACAFACSCPSEEPAGVEWSYHPPSQDAWEDWVRASESQDGIRPMPPPNEREYLIWGAVLHLGVFPIADDLPVTEAVRRAGPITDKADLRQVFLVRRQGASQTASKLDVRSALDAATLDAGPRVHGGDMIIVPTFVPRTDP